MRSWVLTVLGLVLVGACAGLAGAEDLTGEGVPRFALLYFTATLSCLLALTGVVRAPESVPGAGSEVAEPPWARNALWVVLAVALAARGVMLFADPSLSQDCYRYAWEGRVTLSGNNPYVLAPDDPALEPLRDEHIWPQVNHPEVPAIYGPVLQLAFAALALLGGGLLPFKLAFVAADLALAALIFRQLARQRASPFWILLYLWHPLVLLEVAGQCHLELIPIGLLLLALDREASGQPRLAALALGAALASKYLPVLLVPAFLAASPSWRARAERLALIALPGALAVLPFLAAGQGLGEGLSAYGSSWRFNDGGFWLIDHGLEGLGVSQAFCRSVLPAFVHVDPGFDPANHTTWMRIPPKLFVGGLVIAVMGWASWPRAGRVNLERAAFLAGALFLLLSPTVHPWYALWVVPFLPARAAAGERATGAWVLLSLVLPLSYAATAGPVWEDRLWVRGLEYLPFCLLWFAAQVRVLP